MRMYLNTPFRLRRYRHGSALDCTTLIALNTESAFRIETRADCFNQTRLFFKRPIIHSPPQTFPSGCRMKICSINTPFRYAVLTTTCFTFRFLWPSMAKSVRNVTCSAIVGEGGGSKLDAREGFLRRSRGWHLQPHPEFFRSLIADFPSC